MNVRTSYKIITKLSTKTIITIRWDSVDEHYGNWRKYFIINPTIMFSINRPILMAFTVRQSRCGMMHMKKSELYKNCYRILGVEDSANQNTVRRAYIELVKKVHPDSGFAEASAERFHQVDEAFKHLQEKFAKNRRGIDESDEVIEFDIRHTAPQHRQYLNFDGVGIGSPFQRQKQYQQIKVMKAQNNVLQHRIEVSQAGERNLMKKGSYFKTHAIKTKYGFERVVEDLIQEAMSKGNFENLSGAGKPLSSAQSQNPYLDFTTHKLNKILLDNGFTPEWITLQKEIRETIFELKQSIRKERSFYGEHPLSEQDYAHWQDMLSTGFESDVQRINKNIDKFNLIVPLLQNQLLRLNLQKIADEILRDPSAIRSAKRPTVNSKSSTNDNSKSEFLSFLGSWF